MSSYQSPHLRKSSDAHLVYKQAFSREWMTPSEAAEKYIKIDRTGEPIQDYDFDLTPYSREPLDTGASKKFEAVFFIAPQQAGKTQPLLALMGYHAMIQPAPFLLVEKNQIEQRNFTRERLDKTIACSPHWQGVMTGEKKHDTDNNKTYANGAYHEITSPTINSLAGKPVRIVGITDYDRLSHILGHGNVFALAHARSKTFGFGRMTWVESSPGFNILDEKVDKETGELLELQPHEFPPCEGIGSLYNRGDRRRWYWQCHSKKCKKWYLGTFDRISYRAEKGMDPLEIADTARMECPHCGHQHHERYKDDMNLDAHWIGPKQSLTKDGKIEGDAIRSSMASFWLPGPAAHWQDWGLMVLAQRDAMRVYEETGDESELETTAKSDQCMPYVPQVRLQGRTADVLKARAEIFPKRVVPFGVRYLTATVDVQGNRFDVLVLGWGVGRECWVIDRFRIANVEPESSVADWTKSITKQVIHRVYPLQGLKSKWMKIKCVGSDSQGKAGVTSIAYDYWRTLLDDHLVNRFMLLRGRPVGAQIMETRPELTSQRQLKKGQKKIAEARAAVVHQINVNTTKDAVDKMLERPGDQATEENPMVIHFAKWLPKYIYPEITAEVRGTDGKWDFPGTYKSPNETLDLLGYGVAINWALDAFQIDWNDPPPWADTWAENTLVTRELEEYHLDASLID